MPVKFYSLKLDGNRNLIDNFKVKEFACSDGSDKIFIDDALVAALQKIRDHFARPVTINSGYRTEAYNKAGLNQQQAEYFYKIVKGQVK